MQLLKVLIAVLAFAVCINATCIQPQLKQTRQNTWNGNGQSFSQWEVKIENAGTESLIGTSVTIAGALQQIWGLTATLNGRYELPEYVKAAGIAKGQPHTFGYIAQSANQLTIEVSGYYCDIPSTPTLFQVNPLPALSAGVADGNYPIGLLKKRGNFGLGAYEAMNGELVALDGVYYRALYDGTVEVADDTLRVPFASVVNFVADSSYQVSGPKTLPELGAYIDSILRTPNYFYAIKVVGQFVNVTTRVIPTLTKPYPPPLTVGQKTFFRAQDSATLAIIRSPKFTPNSNQGGSHFHYMAEDKAFGGHAVSFTLLTGTLEIQEIKNYFLYFPDNDSFRSANLTN